MSRPPVHAFDTPSDQSTGLPLGGRVMVIAACHGELAIGDMRRVAVLEVRAVVRRACGKRVCVLSCNVLGRSAVPDLR